MKLPERIGPEDFTEADVKRLLDACASDSYGMQFKDLLARLGQNLMAAYRWQGDFRGVMIVKVNLYPGGKEMYIWHLYGRGFLKHIAAVREATRELARGLGCRWVGASTKDPRLTKFYSKLADDVTHNYRMEA